MDNPAITGSLGTITVSTNWQNTVNGTGNVIDTGNLPGPSITAATNEGTAISIDATARTSDDATLYFVIDLIMDVA